MDIEKRDIRLETTEACGKKFSINPADGYSFQQPNVEKKPPEKANKFSENELEILNLIAELIVEIILKETRNECDRICAD